MGFMWVPKKLCFGGFLGVDALIRGSQICRLLSTRRRRYSEVIDRFGDASEPALQAQVARALNNKGYRLGETGDNAGAIETYSKVIDRFGDASESALQAQVATALNGKRIALGQTGDSAEETEN